MFDLQATFKYNPENKCVELMVDRDYQPGAGQSKGSCTEPHPCSWFCLI
jgi:hypothetical protein